MPEAYTEIVEGPGLVLPDAEEEEGPGCRNGPELITSAASEAVRIGLFGV